MSHFLIAAMAPGETSQVFAFARFASTRGDEISLALQYEENANFVQSAAFVKNLLLIPQYLHLHQALEHLRPDALILFISKIFRQYDAFRIEAPTFKPYAVTLDSNWLFSTHPSTAYPYLTWADDYLINLPKSIFQAGLIPSYPRTEISDRATKKQARIFA